MVGLEFALWANGAQLLGVDAKPATEYGPSPTATDAVAGSAMGSIALLWLGAAVVQARGWEMRPIGNLALLAGLRR
jgi:hypothetical protein